MSVHCYEDDIYCSLERIQSIFTFINNLRLVLLEIMVEKEHFEFHIFIWKVDEL